MMTSNMYQELPQKLYYQGPMFRHERPQKGRLRQVFLYPIYITIQNQYILPLVVRPECTFAL